jgi:hypothetical protein
MVAYAVCDCASVDVTIIVQQPLVDENCYMTGVVID